jgi:hypothetical protein
LITGVGLPDVVIKNEEEKPALAEALGSLVMASADGGTTRRHSLESRLVELVLSDDPEYVELPP